MRAATLSRTGGQRAASYPLHFFDAFKEALEAQFGSGARPRQRPTTTGGARTLNPQVSKTFWEQFDKDAPPDLSVRLLEDGYSSFRATLEHRYVWTMGDWVAATALIFLPPIFAYPLIVGMPQTRAMFKEGALVDGQPVDKDKAWFGLVMAPLVTSALAPPILSIYISALTYFGVGWQTVLGWIAGGVNLITAISFLITINGNVDPYVRWILLFIIPFLGLLAHAIYVLSKGGSDPRHIQLALASLVPCIITGVYILFHLAWHTHQGLGMNGWLKETDGQREEWDNAGFLGGWALWAGLLVGGWLILSRVLQGGDAAQPANQAFVTGRHHFLRLFDQSALFFDPNLAQNPNAEERNPTLATHFFPTDRRPLLKVWWEGAGELFMRSERNALRFSTVDGGTAADQFVLAPPAPMTLAELARFLNNAVMEGANFNKKLKAEVVHADDLDYVLPPGELFSDNGDDKKTIADHNTEAVKFTKLKTTSDEASLLYHAPRSRMANFVGKTATVVVDEDRGVDVRGDGEITIAAGSANVIGSPLAGVNTRFTTFFKRGDLIQNSSVPAQTRIVDRVVDDQNLIVTMPFTAAAGPQTYTRVTNNRDDDFPAGNIAPDPAYRVVTGTNFDSTFMVGDIIRAIPVPGPPVAGAALPSAEERIVTQVISATQLMTDKPFSAAVVAATPCVRVGRASREGFRYLPPASLPTGIFSGDTLIDRAADLGAVLAMGAVSHLLTDAERQAVPGGLAEDQRPAVNRVYQVFRNWNLNQRRMNEWRMLVFGNAVSEKRGAPRDPDPMQPGVPAGWTSLTAAGEETANLVGWVPLLQKWVDVARRPNLSSLADEAFLEGDPTNRKLSEGVAFLFDLPMPT